MTLEFSGGNREVPCNNDTYSWIVRYLHSKLSDNAYFFNFFFLNYHQYKEIQNNFSHIFHIPTNKSDLHLLISFEHFASNNV